jgi:hypothetical protein
MKVTRRAKHQRIESGDRSAFAHGRSRDATERLPARARLSKRRQFISSIGTLTAKATPSRPGPRARAASLERKALPSYSGRNSFCALCTLSLGGESVYGASRMVRREPGSCPSARGTAIDGAARRCGSPGGGGSVFRHGAAGSGQWVLGRSRLQRRGVLSTCDVVDAVRACKCRASAQRLLWRRSFRAVQRTVVSRSL